MRICVLGGRGGVGDDRSLLCSSQAHWQPDFVFEMCCTMVEWQSWGLAWLLTAPKVPDKAAEPKHWQHNTYKLLGEIWDEVISQPLYCGC